MACNRAAYSDDLIAGSRSLGGRLSIKRSRWLVRRTACRPLAPMTSSDEIKAWRIMVLTTTESGRDIGCSSNLGFPMAEKINTKVTKEVKKIWLFFPLCPLCFELYL